MYAGLDGELLDLLELVRNWLKGLGDDVQEKELKYYLAYKRLRNFASIELRPQLGHLVMHVKVDPDEVDLEPGFTRNVRNIGHLASGDLEIIVKDHRSFEKAQPLIIRSYEAS